MTIKLKRIILVGYLILIVPAIIFLLGWLKLGFGIIGSVLLLGGFMWLYNSDFSLLEETVEIPRGAFVGTFIALAVFVAISGNCGLFYGGYDIPWRNAILRDMITHPWPVTYMDGSMLCYYIGFWMVPALVGKVAGWTGAMVALWVWETLILETALLLIVNLVGAGTRGKVWAVALILMLFSGLNIIGAIISDIGNFYDFAMDYNEQYAGRFYYRSNLDCIEETYNQIIIWLVVPLMLQNRKIHSYFFLGLLTLPFSPWLVAGIIPFMVVLGVVELVHVAQGLEGASQMGSRRGRVLKHLVFSLFSPANLVGLVVCGIAFGSWFMALLATSAGLDSTSATAVVVDAANNLAADGNRIRGYGLLDVSDYGLFDWAGFFIFVMCEFGWFAVLLFKRCRKDPVYWTMIATLLLVPFFWLGPYQGNDFTMDASLPGLAVCMVLLMDLVVNEVVDKPLNLRNALVVITLCVMALSDCLQFAWLADNLFEARSLSVIRDSTYITTYDGIPYEDSKNFVCPNPDSTFFFSKLAR